MVEHHDNWDMLLIGDLHIKPQDIEEGHRIINWIIDLCQEHNVSPVFLGDLFHFRGIVHVSVELFWLESFAKIKNAIGKKFYVISGNHDMDHDCQYSALAVYEDFINLAWKNTCRLDSGISMLPFYRSNEEFVKRVLEERDLGYKEIFCHQEFNGAKYENGFYAPSGVDLEAIPSDMQFVSGHIHTKQIIDNRVVYVGSSRQLTVSDLGENKGATLYNSKSKVFKTVLVPPEVSEPFVLYKITPENDKIKVPDSPRSIVEIEGPSAFCDKMSKKIPSSVKRRVSADPEKRVVEIKESEGVPVAFRKFFDERTKENEARDEILENIYKKCGFLKTGSEINE